MTYTTYVEDDMVKHSFEYKTGFQLIHYTTNDFELVVEEYVDGLHAFKTIVNTYEEINDIVNHYNELYLNIMSDYPFSKN